MTITSHPADHTASDAADLLEALRAPLRPSTGVATKSVRSPRARDTGLSANPQRHEQRKSPRMRLPVRYTLVRVGNCDQNRGMWTGHAFDIGVTGMCLGLNQPLRVGAYVYTRALLPGTTTLTVIVRGEIVHASDQREERFGLYKMGLAFERFDYLADRRALIRHLQSCGLEIAIPPTKH